MVKERNIGIDAIRGVAAFMVVFTHVIQLYESGSNNIVNNMFLALQMPLFMMVSGYTSKFGKPIETSKQLLSQIGKRSRLLLLPWLSWSLLVYITYKSDTPFFEHVSNVAYHMEGAYWFLFSLWSIDIVFCLAKFINSRFFLKGKRVIGVLIPFYLCLLVYGLIGYFCGFSFLGLKYTLYYQLFFILGFLLTKVELKKMDSFFVEVLLTIFAIVFFCVTCKTNIFELSDSPYSTGIRIFVSMIGCMVVFYSFNKIKWNPDNKLTKIMQWGGVNSLEIYVVHYLLLRIFLQVSQYEINTVNSMVQTVEYFLIVLIVTYMIIEVFSVNPISRLILFGKKIERKRDDERTKSES